MRSCWIGRAAVSFVASCCAVVACNDVDRPARPELIGSAREALSTTCAHDVLCTGGPLQGGSAGNGCTTASGADGYCVPEVCDDIASCCTTAWTNACVQDMVKYTEAGGFKYNDCPSPTANPAPVCASGPTCGECSTHTTPLTSSCDSCTTAVCAADSYCCKTAWDSQCVGEVATDCGSSWCSGGTDAGSGTDSSTDSSVDTGKEGSTDSSVDTGKEGSADSSNDTGTGQDSSGSDSGTPPTLPSPTLAPVAMSNLVFGAFGDVRPANPNDTASYPDTILSAIFAGMQSKGIVVAVDAGDHCFQSSTSSGSYCHTQFVSHFMADMTANYAGKLLPTLGNHEACGTDAATTGNCTSWSSGLIHDYLTDIVLPATGQSSFPYYSVVLYGSWGTAKFVHVAANAWTTGQSTWLTNTLAVPTTYTFVLRHEPANANTAPGVTPSEAIYAPHVSNGTLTLAITGHTHLVQLPGGTAPYGDEYGSTQPYEVIIGNAGAPLDAGPYYGFAVLQRRLSDGAIVVQAYESISSDGTTSLGNAADTNFRFAVNANGASNSNTSLP
jgi:hypothetical protein